VTYQRIELWLGKHGTSRWADLYVQSDKLAKQARFVIDKPAQPPQVGEMLLQDQLGAQSSRACATCRASRARCPTWLNPMFLARNPALE
jgi:hypothetical protein